MGIDFFVDALGFELVEDSPAAANDGRSKRWVVVRPPGAITGVLLARADPDQERVVGDQVAGRVGFFLRVDDFAAAQGRMVAAGVRFVTPTRIEPYGQVAVFLDVAGNRWDLLGPRVADTATSQSGPPGAERFDANAAFPITQDTLDAHLAGFEKPRGEGEQVIAHGDPR